MDFTKVKDIQHIVEYASNIITESYLGASCMNANVDYSSHARECKANCFALLDKVLDIVHESHAMSDKDYKAIRHAIFSAASIDADFNEEFYNLK